MVSPSFDDCRSRFKDVSAGGCHFRKGGYTWAGVVAVDTLLSPREPGAPEFLTHLQTGLGSSP
jgi:hypothetical protein